MHNPNFDSSRILVDNFADILKHGLLIPFITLCRIVNPARASGKCNFSMGIHGCLIGAVKMKEL